MNALHRRMQPLYRRGGGHRLRGVNRSSSVGSRPRAGKYNLSLRRICLRSISPARRNVPLCFFRDKIVVILSTIFCLVLTPIMYRARWNNCNRVLTRSLLRGCVRVLLGCLYCPVSRCRIKKYPQVAFRQGNAVWTLWTLRSIGAATVWIHLDCCLQEREREIQ